jgi:hypothetical protein
MLLRLRRLLIRGLSHPRLPLVLALLAVTLALPSLTVGWQLDDLSQREILLGRTEVSPWDMYSVLRATSLRPYVDSGALPWWTSEHFRLAFLRLLTVATHRLDYALWPDSAALMHAQSLLWFGLLVAAATVLYRRMLGTGWVAGLAALAYAVDDAHAWPAAWIASRSTLLATFFGLLCLLAHDRWRRDGWRPGAWMGPLALALALASGEFAAATLAYLTGHALFLDPAPWRRRFAGFAPYAAVTALWACVYKVGGFGVSGSGLYIDPGAGPARFVAALARRAPFALLGQWTAMPADAGSFLAPLFPPALVLFSFGFVVVIMLLLVPLVRRDSVARFFAAGMLLSTVPISSTFPQNRQLLFVGFGAMGLLAQLVQGAFAGAPWVPASRGWRYAARGVAGLLLPGHLALAPLSFPLQVSMVKTLGSPTETAVASVPTDPALADQDLIVVNSPDYLYLVSPILNLHRLAGQPVPRHLRALATGPSPVEVTRRDAQSLDVRLDRGLFTGVLTLLYRDDGHPLRPGDTISLTGLIITILETGQDGSPTHILYRFDRPLEDPTLRWLRWQDGVYVPFTPPAVGATVHLAPAAGPFDFERPGGGSRRG